jgi:hypothetical protein
LPCGECVLFALRVPWVWALQLSRPHVLVWGGGAVPVLCGKCVLFALPVPRVRVPQLFGPPRFPCLGFRHHKGLGSGEGLGAFDCIVPLEY